MNTKLKFRAWDNKEKKWLLGYEYEKIGGFSLFGECIMAGEWSSILSLFLFERNGYKSEDLIVNVFSGILDKNKKEIYDDDILSDGRIKLRVCRVEGGFVIRAHEWDENNKDMVSFDELISESLTKIQTRAYIKQCCEVVGNIHEEKKI